MHDKSVRKLIRIVALLCTVGGVLYYLFEIKPSRHTAVAAASPQVTAHASPMPAPSASPAAGAAVANPVAAAPPSDEIVQLKQRLAELEARAAAVSPPGSTGAAVNPTPGEKIDKSGYWFMPRGPNAANGDELKWGMKCSPWDPSEACKHKHPVYAGSFSGAAEAMKEAAEAHRPPDPPVVAEEHTPPVVADPRPDEIVPPQATPVPPQMRHYTTWECPRGARQEEGHCLHRVRAWCPPSHSWYYSWVEVDPIKIDHVEPRTESSDTWDPDDRDQRLIEASERREVRRPVQHSINGYVVGSPCPSGGIRQWWGGCKFDHGD